MTSKKVLHFVVLTFAIYFSGCGNKSVQDNESSYYIKGDTVYVKDNDVLASQIKIETVKNQPYSKEITSTGIVQPIPTQFAYIAPPFSGRVTKSYIKLGQQVKANTPLFEIVSPDFTTVQKEFFQASSEKELAEKDMKRKQDLLKNGVASQKEMEEAINALEIAKKEYENAYTALQAYQVKPEETRLGQPLIIRSPISGNVIENSIVTGQFISNETDPVAIIADLSDIWITAQVKEKDIRFIHEGDDMDIHISALPDKVIKGKVFHIEKSVDEDTRAIKVLAVCDNREGLLKLNMYTTVHFTDKPVDFIHIPEKALLQGEKETYVYVKKGENVYLKTPVEVETTINGTAVISDGLSVDDVVISEGGYYLK